MSDDTRIHEKPGVHVEHEARHDEKAFVDAYAEFTRFAVKTAARGSRAVVAANATLVLGGIDALASSAEAWSRTYRAVWLNPGEARPGEKSGDLTSLWHASVEISEKWATDVTRAWAQAASVYVDKLEPKSE